MFVLMIHGRDDRVSSVLSAAPGARGVLRSARSTDGETRVLTPDARTALDLMLAAARAGVTVGCGVGPVLEPVPADLAVAAGGAVLSAQVAVDRAAATATRAAVEASSAADDARRVDALLDLLLVVRRRRSPEGWAVHDLLAAGGTQAEASALLGITPQAVSLRAQAADLRADAAAVDALAGLLQQLDAAVA